MPFDRTQREIVITGPLHCARAITPHDDNNLTNFAGQEQPMEVYVGGAGVVVCIPAGNADADTVAVTVPAGGRVPFLVKRVRNTSTTATLLVGCY